MSAPRLGRRCRTRRSWRRRSWCRCIVRRTRSAQSRNTVPPSTVGCPRTTRRTRRSRCCRSGDLRNTRCRRRPRPRRGRRRPIAFPAYTAFVPPGTRGRTHPRCTPGRQGTRHRRRRSWRRRSSCRRRANRTERGRSRRNAGRTRRPSTPCRGRTSLRTRRNCRDRSSCPCRRCRRAWRRRRTPSRTRPPSRPFRPGTRCRSRRNWHCPSRAKRRPRRRAWSRPGMSELPHRPHLQHLPGLRRRPGTSGRCTRGAVRSRRLLRAAGRAEECPRRNLRFRSDDEMGPDHGLRRNSMSPYLNRPGERLTRGATALPPGDRRTRCPGFGTTRGTHRRLQGPPGWSSPSGHAILPALSQNSLTPARHFLTPARHFLAPRWHQVPAPDTGTGDIVGE